jgi:hypothetical protein
VAKRLELLRELLPAAVRVALLVNPDNVTLSAPPAQRSTMRDLGAAAIETVAMHVEGARPA